MENEHLTSSRTRSSGSSNNNRPMRPQYHFFYGSTGVGDDGASEQGGADSRMSMSTGTQQEQESLIGESLVPTDNEEEEPAPKSNAYDLQHVLISNCHNGGMRHVVGVMNMNGGASNKKNNSGNGNNNSVNGSANSGGAAGIGGMNNSNNGTHPLGDVNSIHHSLVQLRQDHPIVHIVGLVSCMTICMVVFAVALFPSSTQSASNSSMGGTTKSNTVAARKFVLKFPIVDRSKSNDPAKGFLNKELFHPDLLYSGNNPFQEFKFPFPTGAFWTNLVLPPTSDHGYSYPVAVYPYAYKWSESLLATSYPALHRKEEAKAVHDYFFPDLTFGSLEEVYCRQVTGFDPLSVALQFLTSSGGGVGVGGIKKKNGSGGSWKTFLVQGSPYVTIEYDNVTPTITALSIFKSVVCPGEEGLNEKVDEEYDFDDSFDDDSGGSSRRRLLGVCGASTDNDGLTTLRGVQFVLQSQEGVNWIVFSSEPISLVFDTRIGTQVVSSKPFKGTFRLAIIPPSSLVKDPGNGMVKISSSTGLRRLVYHASVYPIGATVDYDFRDPTATATTTTTSVAKSVLSGLAGASGVLVGGTTPQKATTTSSTKPFGGRVASVHFSFVTKTANINANAAAEATGKTTGLLMLSLPHHAFSFTKSHILDSKQFDLVYQCIKGSMTPVVGSVWTYEENLPSLGFEPVVHVSSQPSPETILADKTIRKLLSDNLEDDLKIAPPSRTENIYGFGKQIARLAQLAHIADKLVGPGNPPDSGETLSNETSTRNKTSSSHSSSSSSSSSSLDERTVKIRQAAMKKLSDNLEVLLTNQLSDSLLYDASLGGLVSTDGLADWNADFGNGRYNDHHFHYGYLLYACAVMGRLNATFVEEHGDRVDAILHDVAYNANVKDDSFFPLARHMSWFDGHSFASGLFPFGNGKSQESSSEAVNCYYGAYLWSLVRSGSADKPSADVTLMTDFARLLLAMEIRGAKTYWHMMPPPPSSPSSTSSSSSSGSSSNISTTAPASPITTPASPMVYSPHFAANYMVGNLGMLDAICSTWFGTENLYVHMINFLPVTSITRELFNKEYVVQEYSNVISHYGEVEMAWRGYVVCDHALVEPMKAWKEALDLKSDQLDSGLSKTQTLYFIAMSPSGIDLSQLSGGSGSSAASDSSKSDSSSSRSSGGTSGGEADCSKHAACATAGLGGFCCPTTAGGFLDCCNQ